jgi:Arc/MetJ family transcription regulator
MLVYKISMSWSTTQGTWTQTPGELPEPEVDVDPEQLAEKVRHTDIQVPSVTYVYIVYDNWEVHIFKDQLGRSLEEQEQKAKLIKDSLQAIPNVRVISALRDERGVYIYKFSIKARYDEITDIVFKIYDTFTAYSYNWKTYKGNIQAYIGYDDGKEDVINIDVTSRDLINVTDAVIDEVFKHMKTKYEEVGGLSKDATLKEEEIENAQTVEPNKIYIKLRGGFEEIRPFDDLSSDEIDIILNWANSFLLNTKAYDEKMCYLHKKPWDAHTLEESDYDKKYHKSSPLIGTPWNKDAPTSYEPW